jgi:hypothetical protein
LLSKTPRRSASGAFSVIGGRYFTRAWKLTEKLVGAPFVDLPFMLPLGFRQTYFTAGS